MFQKKTARKIDFLLIGAQKSGTSALAHYMGQHPDIGMARTKEVHFFDRDENFAKQKTDYALYHQHFDFSKNHKIFGEATPIYLYWRPACQRIWEYNPSLKLIAILRNPIDRAFSHWTMEYERGAEKESFWNAIRQEPERLKEGQHRVYSYVDRGFYANQIERFQAKFSAEQLLFIKYEDFKADQEGTLAKVFSFLGVEHKGFTFTPERIHESAYRSSITPEEREYLKSVFTTDIHEVEKLLGWDCTDWLSGT